MDNYVLKLNDEPHKFLLLSTDDLPMREKLNLTVQHIRNQNKILVYQKLFKHFKIMNK